MNFSELLKTVGNWLATEGIKIVLALIVFILFCIIVNKISAKLEKKRSKKEFR